jgi:FHA domain
MTWLEHNETLHKLRTDGDLVVGSGAQATLRVTSADLMPRHFIISLDDDGAKLRPFSGESVVSLNGRQVTCESTALADGDSILAGATQFVFWSGTPKPRSVGSTTTAVAHLLDVRTTVAHALTSVSTGIGADPSNAVLLLEPHASPFHAEVRREAGGYALHVLDRGTGIAGARLNGQRISAPTLLTEGDVIELGSSNFRFTVEPLPPGVSLAAPLLIDDVDLLSGPTVMLRRFSAPPTEEIVAFASRAPTAAFFIAGSLVALMAVAMLFFMHGGA